MSLAAAAPIVAKQEGATAIRIRRVLTHVAIFTVVVGGWELLGVMGQLTI